MTAPAGVVNVSLARYAAELFRPHRYKVMYGGRGGGRSWSAARALLIQAHAQPLRVLCVREIQNSIQDSVHRLLKDQVELLGLPFRVTRTEITHPNGSLFIFHGLHANITKIKSIEGIDRCWAEEAETISDDSWKVLIPTIRKAGSEIWVTFNPDREDDPTYKRLVINTPPGAWVVKVGSEHNPWLPDELRAERDYAWRTDPESARHVWGGECRTQTDAEVLAGKWVVAPFEVGDDWAGPYQGCDFGFAKDPAVLIRVWVRDLEHDPEFAEQFDDGTELPPRRELYVEYEAYRVGLELDHTAPYWRRTVPNSHRYTTRADSADPQSISYLRRHGFPRVRAVKKWGGSVEDGIRFLRSFERIVIHPRCRHTVDEAKHYSYKRDRHTGDILPEIVDANNHAIDSIRYALEPLIYADRGAAVAGAWFPGMDELPPLDEVDDAAGVPWHPDTGPL